MITTDQINDLAAQLTELVNKADDAGELFGLMMHFNDVVAQRASDIMAVESKNTERFEFAVQAHKDAHSASDNAERMQNWYLDVAPAI